MKKQIYVSVLYFPTSYTQQNYKTNLYYFQYFNVQINILMLRINKEFIKFY